MTSTFPDLSVGADVMNQWVDWVRGHSDDDIPSPQPRPSSVGKWWIDEWSMQVELAQGRWRVPDVTFRRRLREELVEARTLFDEQGWIKNPRSYHQEPPATTDLVVKSAPFAGLPLERFRFDSDFEPHPDEPGRDRWLNYPKVNEAAGWILRHDDYENRPWIFVVNGYRTGDLATDLLSFRVKHLYRDLGLNVANVTLPLHGPRALGETSGARVLNSGAMNTINTITHGAWDIRRVLTWLRTEMGAKQIGVSGISLGGYMVSLLSCLDEDLACVIAGVPESDLVRGMRRHIDSFLPPFYEQWGLSWGPLERVFTPVSPLAMPSQVAHDRRYIYAGLLDRWVRPGNVKTLWEHWDQPSIHWYQGSHLSFPFEKSVHRYVDAALREALPVRN
jgi:hypothetical protein